MMHRIQRFNKAETVLGTVGAHGLVCVRTNLCADVMKHLLLCLPQQLKSGAGIDDQLLGIKML